jgi:hypothetical protein
MHTYLVYFASSNNNADQEKTNFISRLFGKIKNVFNNDDSGYTPQLDAIFIKDGFNFTAFVLGIFWLAWNNMWRYLLVAVLVQVIAFELLEYDMLTRSGYNIIQLALSFIIGMIANDLYGEKLIKDNYLPAGIVLAKSLVEAQQRYFSSRDNLEDN